MLNDNPWHVFDSIRCINLRTRPDRLESASTIFKRNQIPVEWFTAERHPSSGVQGCFESHVSCIRESYLKGDETCLIFEDDIQDTQETRNTPGDLLTQAISFITTRSNWDIFYFGCCPNIINHRTYKVRTKQSFSNILRVRATCAHAYVISRRYMKRLYNLKFDGTPIDALYLNNPNTYGVFPSLFYQNAWGSDIGNTSWNSFKYKNLWFNTLESYARFVNKPIKLISTIIFVGLVGILVVVRVLASDRHLWTVFILFVMIMLMIVI